MCGIAGIYNLNNKAVDLNKLLEMTRIIRHRGPDDEGFISVNTKNKTIDACYHDETIEEVKKNTVYLNNIHPGNLAFGFRRLSILDLTAKGHQPMCSKDRGLWIVFNGEIYNYLELRSELEKYGYSFKSNTDTEVVIYAYQHWGERCLNRFNGMWSFALWDNKRNRLFCARDRYGIKPFYYYHDKNQFVFGSEIKQMLVHSIDRKLNKKMVFRSMKLNSFLSYKDETFFEKIHTLPHAHYLIIDNGKISVNQYYDIDISKLESSDINFNEAVESYLNIFKDSVKIRMRSDVEVGSCLSGGLDSSAIVTLAATLTNRQFKTYSAFYDEGPLYDERKWIDIVNKAVNAKGHLIEPNTEEFIKDFGRMTFINDYPIIGPSLISQHYVMKLARQNSTTVVLDGQGSDELTGGYNHSFYRYYADLLRSLNLIRFVREYPAYLKYNKKGNVLDKIIRTLLALIFREAKIYNMESRYQLDNILSYSYGRDNIFGHIKDLNTSKLSNFLYNLVMSTMLQTLLHFEDRNSMAYSIESRVPFLDYRLVDFVFTLPPEFKIHKNYGKYIHRKALEKIAPKEIAERKDKVGFASPAETIWLRGAMKPMVDEMFNSQDFKNREVFNHSLILDKYDEFLKGNKKLGKMIWRVISLEKWFEEVYEF